MQYKLLGKSGVRVSELCLGTMTFGEDWGWGASKAESRAIFDRFVEAGGNFIDTACNYTEGTSERFVGEFVGAERHRFVVATKYTLTKDKANPNGGGNSRKSMVQTLEGSLKRLNMEYVDLLWLHMWDFTTSLEEVMRGLDDLVRAGKVLYVGFSDTPAWVVAQADTMAALRGWSRVVAYQAPYNLLSRDLEREAFPMARALDIAVTPWGLLSGGVLTGKYLRQTDEPKRYQPRNDAPAPHVIRMVTEVGHIAEELGRTPTQVAVAWVRQQGSGAQIIPILGARTEAQIKDNLGALDLTLSAEHLARLEAASEFRRGFPMDFLFGDEVQRLVHGEFVGRLDNHRLSG
jgi:aryl-alcohol dehydrogenase-like predicted oxidoreductase